MKTIDLLLSHRSIRKFTPEPLEAGQLEQIIRAAQSASTSSFVQCTSVIRVTSADKKQRLAELAGNQAYVAECAEFLVFCADFNRHRRLLSSMEPDFSPQLGWTEHMLIGAIDTALMGQNAMVAAESLGLGGCFIGGIRNQPQAVSELLYLPELVIPLFGLCLGHPAQDPEQKPRLPLDSVLHQDGYQPVELDLRQQEYDAQISRYYRERTGGQRKDTWLEQIKGFFAKESRPHMLEFLRQRGFLLR